MRSKFMTLTGILILNACTAAMPAGAVEAVEFTDRVGTLDLDTELDARGTLGGMTIDALGFIYVANFRDAVWRIDPDGGTTLLSRALYGSSGNAVDSRGRLYQANFNANTISRIERDGSIETFADEGLNGPVGIAIAKDGTLYVCNCSGNTISRVSADGKVSDFASGELFACPNGIAFGGDGALYVTNFNSHDIARVALDGSVSKFATVTGGAGNAHITYAKGFFFVTKIVASQIVKVAADGSFTVIAGSGQPGHEDGAALEARFYRPNGITVNANGDRLFVNTVVGEHAVAKRSQISVRTIDLTSLSKVVEKALDAGSIEEAERVYRAYRSDSVRGQENTVAEMTALGYRYLSALKIPEALTLFRLNADSYPDDRNAQFHLGEAYRYTGQSDNAIAQYRRVLAIDPEDAQAASWLAKLDGG